MQQEKTGKRNLSYSFRHKHYPHSFYLCDIDSVMSNYGEVPGCFVESDWRPRIFIETKFGYIDEISLNSIEIKTTIWTADKCGCPAFLVIYYPFNGNDLLDANDVDIKMTKLTHMQYRVIGLNSAGKKICPTIKDMTEHMYVWFIAKIRKQDISDYNKHLYDSWKPVKAVTIS